MDKLNVLIAEDDPRVLKLERLVLERAGYQTTEVHDGNAALETVINEAPALLLLDINMPGLDGFHVCRRVREFSDMAIIVVTGRDSEDEKVRGLEAGADDYVAKPFSSRELLARVQAVLRRSARKDDIVTEPVIQLGDLVVDFHQNTVTQAGRELTLSGIEYRLLSYLARNAGRVLTPAQILQQVWGEEYEMEHHLLRVTMTRLRQRLGDDSRSPRYIITRKGIGYSLLKPPPDAR